MNQVSKIAAGENYSVFLTFQNELYLAGRLFYNEPIRNFQKIEKDFNIIQISAGRSFFYCLSGILFQSILISFFR